LNHVDHFYFNRVGPLVPAGVFCLYEERFRVLKSYLHVELEGVDKTVIQDACETFVNAVAFDQLRANRIPLGNYAGDLAKRAGSLVAFLKEPEKVNSEYSQVHETLLSNSAAASLTVGREELLLLIEQIEILVADILRVSRDHGPARRPIGGQADLAFVEFMMTLRFIAETAGADMTLPENQDNRRSSPYRKFAVAVLLFAIEQGTQGITDSINLCDTDKRRARLALGRYRGKLHLVTDYLRAPEKRKRRRTRAGGEHLVL
jgi:hypothetical protein